MADDGLENYADLWTDELHKYELVELESGDWLIFDRVAHAPLVIETSAEILDQIIEQLRKAGAPERRRA